MLSQSDLEMRLDDESVTVPSPLEQQLHFGVRVSSAKLRRSQDSSDATTIGSGTSDSKSFPSSSRPSSSSATKKSSTAFLDALFAEVENESQPQNQLKVRPSSSSGKHRSTASQDQNVTKHASSESHSKPHQLLWDSLQELVRGPPEAQYIRFTVGEELIDRNDKAFEELHSCIRILDDLRIKQQKDELEEAHTTHQPSGNFDLKLPMPPPPVLRGSSSGSVRPKTLPSVQKNFLVLRLRQLLNEAKVLVSPTGVENELSVTRRDRQVLDFVLERQLEANALPTAASEQHQGVAAGDASHVVSPKTQKLNQELLKQRDAQLTPSSVSSASTSRRRFADPLSGLSELTPSLKFDRVDSIKVELRGLFQLEHELILEDIAAVQNWIQKGIDQWTKQQPSRLKSSSSSSRPTSSQSQHSTPPPGVKGEDSQSETLGGVRLRHPTNFVGKLSPSPKLDPLPRDDVACEPSDLELRELTKKTENLILRAETAAMLNPTRTDAKKKACVGSMQISETTSTAVGISGLLRRSSLPSLSKPTGASGNTK